MRVFLTGATGLTGSHAMAALVREGHELCALVRSEDKLRRVCADRGVPLPSFVVGDMTEAASVRKGLDGCDAVVHAAGVVSIEAKRANEVLHGNIEGTRLVVGCALDAGVERAVCISSLSAIFDPDAGALTAASEVHETTSAYSRSKAAAERRVRAWQEEGAPIATIYPGAILGPRDPGLSGANMGLSIFVKKFVFDTSGGYQAVDVRDLADATCRLLERGGSGRYVAAGNFLTWPRLADLLGEICGRRIRRVPGPGALFRGAGVVGDIVKRVLPFDFPLTHEAMVFVTKQYPVEDSPELLALGCRFRGAREMYTDAVLGLLEDGHLLPKHVPRLAGEAVHPHDGADRGDPD